VTEPVLRLEDLRAYFFTPEGVIKAVNGVSFALERGSTLAILGESGAGKTSVGLAILNLLPRPGRIVGGRVFLEGREITALKAEELRQIRGREIAMIFQDPVGGLNPLLPIGVQVEEIITSHLPLSRKEAKRRSLELLAQMGLAEPEQVASRYPFHLSGGMCQRVMIAIATAFNPKVLIADEPTSALDVTVQAAILQELADLRRRYGTSILLITHDIGVVAQMAEQVAVMYAGSIVEMGELVDVFHYPRHPYTWALLAARPRLDRTPGQTPPLHPGHSAQPGRSARPARRVSLPVPLPQGSQPLPAGASTTPEGAIRTAHGGLPQSDRPPRGDRLAKAASSGRAHILARSCTSSSRASSRRSSCGRNDAMMPPFIPTSASSSRR
jgi:ABC-type dipeptide/oligopeptide/nickel transport system ATPase component